MGPGAQDEVLVVPFASTRMLSEADLATLAPDAGDGRLRFASAPPALAALERGQVIVAGKSERTPRGLLRVVKAVHESGGGLELETVQAPLQLAFRKVHIRSARRSTGQLGSEPWPGNLELQSFDPFQRHVGATQQVHVVVFDGDGDVTTTNDQVSLDGELGGDIDFRLQLDFDWGLLDDPPQLVKDCVSGLLELSFDCSLAELLPEAKAVFEAAPGLASHLELHGASILEFQKDFVLYESNLGELVYGPVIVTPHVQIVARVEGAASAAFRTEVNAAIEFDTSVTLSSKHPSTPEFQPPELRQVSLDAQPPELTLTARARAGLGAELSLLIYGVTGPFLSARAFGAVDADVFRDPCVQLSAGLEGSLGVKVTTPAVLFLDPIDLIDWRAELGPVEQTLDVPVPACEAPPDASTLPPGSGPDANHLAMPSFEPWSRSWGALMDSAAANPGGTTYWIDQEHSIDGRVVVAGRGAAALTKLDEAGTLTWSRQFFEDRSDPFSRLHPVRVISTLDAALLVLAEKGLPPLSLIKVTQAGNVLFRRELDLPNPIDCGLKPGGLARDGGAGFYAVVTCTLSRQVYLVHLDAEAQVLDAVSFRDPAATVLDPMVALSTGSDLFVSGRVSRPLDSMFALRRRAGGDLAFASRYEACSEAPDVYPVRALMESNGDVTVAGRGGAEHNGFLARLKGDGAVGFAAFPGFGFGLGSVFVLDSIAELPTTGYVVSASAVRFTGEAPENVPGIALLQLDAVGQPVWARRYAMQASSGEFVSSAQTDLHLSDDGGIFVTAISHRQPQELSADVWAMKVAAKDGLISFAPNAAASWAATTLEALPCSLTQTPWDITFQDEPEVATRLVPTDVVDAEPEGAEQN